MRSGYLNILFIFLPRIPEHGLAYLEHLINVFKERVIQSFKLLDIDDMRQVPYYPTYACLITLYFKDLTCEEGIQISSYLLGSYEHCI